MAKKKARRKQEIPLGETDAARFIRVVTPRVNKAVKAIDVIGFCTGSSYEYSTEQTKKIHDVLADAVGRLSKKFAGVAGADGGFSLK